MKIFSYFLTLVCLFSSLNAASYQFGNDPQIVINNRILAIINDKPISVLDLMKKMDMVFYRQYPQYASSPQAKHQFYNMSWKPVLQESIDKELVLADAEHLQLQLSNGEIREEMETIFGPNMIENLDSSGLTYEEAWDLVRSEMILQRMMYYRVNSKVMRLVTPEVMMNAYSKWAEENKQPEQWCYRVISLRGDNAEKLEATSQELFYKLTKEQIAPEELVDKVNLPESVQLTVSDTFEHPVAELSSTYKEALVQLEPGTYSQPIKQNKNNSFRIFFLKEIQPETTVAFSSVEHEIKEKLLEAEMRKESDEYLANLRKKYHYDENHLEDWIPTNFEPFLLTK